MLCENLIKSRRAQMSLAPIFLSKKGQMGETMTWVIATLVIVVILSISVIATFSITNKKLIFLDDKEKDFIATKSITNFLRNSNNVNLLESENYDVFLKNTENLLKIFPEQPFGGIGGWNFELSGDNIETLSVSNYKLITNIGQYDYFKTIFIFKQIKLKFWEECQGICR